MDCSPTLIQYISCHHLEVYPLSTVRHFLFNISPSTSSNPTSCRLFATSYSIYSLPPSGDLPLVGSSPLLIQHIPFHQLEAHPLSAIRHFLSNTSPAPSWRPTPCQLFATSYSIHPLPPAGGLTIVGCSPLVQYIRSTTCRPTPCRLFATSYSIHPLHHLEAYPLSSVRHFLFRIFPATLHV